MTRLLRGVERNPSSKSQTRFDLCLQIVPEHFTENLLQERGSSQTKQQHLHDCYGDRSLYSSDPNTVEAELKPEGLALYHRRSFSGHADC